MDNASFTWETDLAPSISNLSLKIKRGSFVAIVVVV
jgi:ABC-type bacteriocin/lantibiotic exporter with double-glycine peptidase domain